MSDSIKYPIKEVKIDVWSKKVSCTSMFTIPAEDEALPVLKEFDEMLTRLLTLPLEETLHQSCVQFFFVQVFPVVCQKIIRSRYFKSTIVLRFANSVLQSSVYLVHKYLEIGIKYPRFLQILPTVFSTDQYYFKSNDQLSYYHYPYSYFPSKTNFADKLNIGDLIDVLKIDNLFDKLTWSQGKIIQVYDNDFQIAYLHDCEDKTVKIRRDSPQLAPYNSRSKQNMQWRLNLKVGDLIDCEEMYGNWYNATVTGIIQLQKDVESQYKKKKVQVNFRVYNPKGNRTDQKGNNYYGSIMQQQVQIDCTNPKIAPYCSVAKQFSYETGKTVYDYIDDLNDYEFQQYNGSHIYAIPRKKYLSSLLFNTINGFGQAGGFDKIIQYLEKEINYDVFCYFAKGLSGVTPYLHRKFIIQIIHRLKNLVQRYIFEDPEKMAKQFTKQKSQMIFSGIRSLQKRIFSTDTVYKFENNLKMRLVQSCLDNKLTQKLQGLNQLKDIVKNGSYVSQKNRQIKNWIKENKIFEKIYITNSHAQLIKKSEDFFKYLISQAILEVTDLERLYKIAQKSDFETRISLYKLFQEVAYLFKKNHVQFLIDTILESQLSLIRNQDIDLLHELSRFSNYFPLDKVIMFFENIILSNENGNKITQVNDYAIKKYSDIVVRNHEMKSRRRNIIKNFLSKMATHDISQITKVLKGIFQGIGIGQWGKKDLYQILADEKVDEVAVQALKTNKQDPQFEYIFKEVLGFLLSIYKLSYKIKIHVTTLTDIWDIIEGSQQNQRTFYKWVNQQFDKCEQGLQCQTADQFESFYRKLFVSERIKKMQGLQFELAKNLFIQANKKAKILSVTNYLRNNSQQRQYKRKIEIRQMKLIDLLIQMVFQIQDTDNSEKALVFFIELYNSKENSQIQIDQFLEQLLKDFKDYYKSKSYKMINKIIKLFDVVINDSQKNYDAGIGSLLKKKKKKDKMKFIIINEIYYSTQTVKKVDMFLEMNTTVMDLRKKLAKQFDTTWQQIRITSTRQIPDHQNSKTIEQILLNPNTPLTVTKRIIYSEPEGQLLIGDQLNPKAIRCFKKIFQKYSTDGFMNKDQCNLFTGMCLGSTSSKKHYSQKISSLYNKYDHDDDGFLVFDNFLVFYKDAADDRPMTVWSNLRSFGVRGNFRFRDQPEQQNGGISKFPRATLAESKQFYQILFQLLKVKQCSSLSYELLERLPVYSEIEDKILSIKNQEDIQKLLRCEGQYQLFYKLSIIQYLVNSEQLTSEKEKNFHMKFIECHGYQQFYQLAKKSAITSSNIQQAVRSSSGDSDQSLQYQNANIDINQYLLYTTLALLRNFWFDYFSKKYETNSEKNKMAESMALLIVDYEIDQKIQYLVTGLFPKKQQCLDIRSKILGQNISLQQYKWKGEFNEQKCDEILLMLQQLWASYKQSSQLYQQYSSNPLMKQKITSIIYVLTLLISKTLQIVNILFLNKKKMAGKLIQKLLELLDAYLPNSSLSTSGTKILGEVYCTILCQCFYADENSDVETHQKQDSTANIQSIYIKELFRNLTKGNITSEHFRVLAVLVSKFGIAGEQKQEDGEIQKMKNILFDNVLTNTNQLTIEGCAQLLCNFRLNNTTYQQFLKLWQERLFNPQTICQKQQTKTTLYKLILKICDYNPKQINKIIHKVYETIKQKSNQMKIVYCNQFKQRSITGYSGLKNLGNICYMNSMLQQIYMNKVFRYLFLRICDYKQNTQTEVFDQKQQRMRTVDDNLLHQTQRIFAFLDLSTRVDYIPKDFCLSYKPFGQPIDIMIQQDVQEFVSMFFDRIESFINFTPFKNMVQDFYSGKTANIFKCHNCKKAKKVEQNFHCLTLQIKNAKNLAESFVRFITGEQITDFRCDFCEQKVDVQKKTVISKSPKILLIHLQRIIFNLDTFVNEKLSTKHSFPHNFNIYPYTLQYDQGKQKGKDGAVKNEQQGEQSDHMQKSEHSQEYHSQSQHQKDHIKDNSEREQQPQISGKQNSSSKKQSKNKKQKVKDLKQQYEYQLTGIVCHSGHAEGGHYISYIKTDDNKWLEFNDSIITYFNASNIESQCFGGSFATSSAYDDDYDWDSKRQTSKCAYMVIYQRKGDYESNNIIKLIIDQQVKKQTKLTKQQLLKQYDLQQLLVKLQVDNDKKVFNKNKRQVQQQGGIKQQQQLQTGDNLTNQKNPNQSQQQSSEVHQDSQRENKKLLADKQLQIKRHQSQDNIDVQPKPEQNNTMQPDINTHKSAQLKQQIISIDVNQIKPYISSQLAQQVHNDNIVHFFERCLSSSNFSKFFAELLVKPHTLHKELLPECQKLTFGFWLKSPSFKQLLNMLDFMIKGNPQGFQTVITQNKAVISLLIQCSDSDVRTNMAAFLSKSIADVIQSRQDFDVQNPEQPIVKFLDHLLELLPTTVTKCWTKFSQYFEFWHQLAQKNRKTFQYMINRQIIKHFMDYFLDTKSPLKIYCNKKAGAIGSSYASPNFSYLLKCVSILLQQKLTRDKISEAQNKKIIKLTDDEQLLLISCQSLEKLISDSYQYIAAQLVKQICPNNLYASQRVAFVILKGISKSSYETIQPYLQVLHEFVTIQDEYQDMRIRWVLGKQTLAVSTYAKKIIAINSYTLDERIYNFDSSLYTETGASLLDYLFVYYRKMQNFSMLCLKQILKLCEQSPKIRKYIYSLDSPTLSMSKYCDFFKEFINRVCGYYGYYSAAFNKQQLGKQLKVLHAKVLTKVQEDNLKQSPIQQDNNNKCEYNNDNRDQSDNNTNKNADNNASKNNNQQVKQQNVKSIPMRQQALATNDVSNKEEYDNYGNQKMQQYYQQHQQHVIKDSDSDDQMKGKNETKEQSIHDLDLCGKGVEFVEIQMDDMATQKLENKQSNQQSNKQSNQQSNKQQNFSFKGQNNHEQQQSYNSWQDLPNLQTAKSRQDQSSGAKDNIAGRQKSGKRKNQYNINVLLADKQRGQYDEITSMEFSSEEDEPLMRSKADNQHVDADEMKKKNCAMDISKDYTQTYHPIIFQYMPIGQIIPVQQQGTDTYPKDVKIFHHESLVTFALTKPTGNTNRSVQMGMNGQKVVDRLLPQVMQSTKTHIIPGFFVRNDTRDFIRIETDDGCSYCKGLQSVWVWCNQINRVWMSERCIDLPKWSLYEEQRKQKANKK